MRQTLWVRHSAHQVDRHVSDRGERGWIKLASMEKEALRLASAPKRVAFAALLTVVGVNAIDKRSGRAALPAGAHQSFVASRASASS
jgi:hypothetical protein